MKNEDDGSVQDPALVTGDAAIQDGDDDAGSKTDVVHIVPCVFIPPHHWVPQALYDKVYKRMSESIPNLKPKRIYKTQDMLGKAYWKSKSNDNRRAIGRVLAHLVCTGRLPLEFASCPYCTTKRYRLK